MFLLGYYFVGIDINRKVVQFFLIQKVHLKNKEKIGPRNHSEKEWGTFKKYIVFFTHEGGQKKKGFRKNVQ